MKRILVIDDTEELRRIISESLQAMGWTTVTADDGQNGYDAAVKHLPDLILCDIQMPRMDGYQVLAKLRENRATSAIPFVFLTGVNDWEDIRQGMILGADDYLTKPFTIKELIASVQARFKKQDTLQQASEKKLDDLRGSITLALPHELITPLNGIIGFASLLESDPEMPPEEVQEFARNIHQSAQRLHRVIGNFLLFSQLEILKSDPSKQSAFAKSEPTPCRDCIRRTATAKAEEHTRRNDLVLMAEEALLPIAPRWLEKILQEIIDNAFKFSLPGSLVIVKLQPQEGIHRLSVSDSGRGMSPDQIATIGAHQQFDRQKHEQQGSGLGLSIAKRLAELHGGCLHVECVPGKQTTIMVDFPR